MSGPTVRGSGPRRPRSDRTGLLLVAALSIMACGDGSTPTDPLQPEARVSTIEVVGGSNQSIWSGRRSVAPFRIRARDERGEPVADAEVVFRVVGAAGGDPSQPLALTDRNGYAESWLQRARAGTGILVAETGTAQAEIPFTVERAPGEIRFLPGTGEVGLPGHPHPDSVLSVRLTDTEGKPLAGHEIWFAGPGRLSRFADTTGADGTASVRLRLTDLAAGSGYVYAFMLAFPELLARDTRPLAKPAERVVLVSVDGLRADAAERWSAPTLQRLAREGAVQARARALTPTLTAPSHITLMSGVGPESHGVFADALDFTPEMATLDPVFRHASRRGSNAVAFIGREGPLAQFERALACRLAFGLDSLYLTTPTAAGVVDAAEAALADPSVDLIFLHLPDPDVAGHRYGFDSPQYGAAVLAADAALERVRAALAGVPGGLMIVTSDHGGGGAWGPFQHGSDSPEDVEVPILLWGARVSPGQLEPATLLDVAPTILWALGMTPPGAYQGRPLLEGFR